MRTRHPFEDVPLEFETYAEFPEVKTLDVPADIALGFRPHAGENRKTRRAAVANFSHPGVSRRELLKQRQRNRRGKLDVELRRLQRKATK